MRLVTLKHGLLALSLLGTVKAHTGITNFYVDGVDQGDGVCVRMNPDPQKWSFPVEDLNSPDMACGFGGTKGVGRTCEVNDGATVTLEWRMNPNKPGGGVIDPSHKGPCAVYMKRVGSAQEDGAVGDGWFKLWDQGYDDSTKSKWCTLNLIDAQGRMTVQLPPGLAGGEYLLRGEALALHNANQGDPQYYIGCAQIFLQSSGSLIPENTVSIPGTVSKSDAANSFNLYTNPMKLPYPVPGPPVASFKSGGQAPNVNMRTGLQPGGCLLEAGSNWCGFEVADYSNEAGCWAASDACYKQEDACYKAAPPTGNENCKLWEDKCAGIQKQCKQGNFKGPPNKGQVLTPPKSTINPPAPLGPTQGGNAGQAQPTGVGKPSTSSTILTHAQNALPTTPVAPSPESPTYTPPPPASANPTRSSTTFDAIKSSLSSSSATEPNLSTHAAPVIASPSPSACGPLSTVTVTNTAVVTVTVTATSSSALAVPKPKENNQLTSSSSAAYQSHSWPWWFSARAQRAKATAKARAY